MKKLVQVAVALVLLSVLSPVSFAAKRHSDPANDRARALIHRMKTAKPKKPLQVATPLLNFSSSPAQGLQNQTLSWIVQFDNPFTNRELSIEVKNNGQKVTNVQSPYKGMFLVSLGLQTEARANNLLEVTLFAEDPLTQTDTRNAVKLLDTDIRRLTNQINSTRDPAQRAILQEQRDEKVALKNELLTQLKKFRWRLGSQSQKYSIVADSNSESLPKITSLSPVWGDVRGGTLVTISGMNFSENVSVLFGGLASPSVTFVNNTTVQAIVPDFEAAVGGKDVELRFSQDGVTRNVISPSAFFAANVADPVPTQPVAIASGSLRLDLGESALLDGTLSYTANPSTLGYSWKVASAPATSNYTVGQEVGTAATASVTPSAYGTYAFSLVVRDLDTPEHLESEPSIVVVQVDGGPQPVANSITVASGAIATTQVIANDPTPGEAISFAIAQGPAQGTASVSSTGLVTYQAPQNHVGADSIVVRVSDQSGHSVELTIPILVVSYTHAPSPFAAPIVTHSEPGSTQVQANDPDEGQTFSYAIIAGPSHGTASISSSGLLSYQSASGYVGPDSVTIRVSDSGEPISHGIALVDITVNANTAPVVSAPNIILSQNSTSGTSQASIQDDEGQAGSYSVSEPSFGTASVSAVGLVTYTPGGSYAGSDAVAVSYTDNGNPALTGTKTIQIYTNDPPIASAPAITVTTGGTGTSQISATDPNPGQSIGYYLASEPQYGTAEVSASGLVTYHSTGGYTGGDSLIVTVFDNGTPQMSTPVEIQVTVEANHAPTGSAPSIEVASLGTGTSQITASANDPGETLSYAISAQPTNGTASVSESGLVTFTSNSTGASSSSIGVSVTDSGFPNLSTTISIPVSVTGPVNQPPVVPAPLFYRIQSQGVPYQVALSLSGNATPSGGVTDPDGTIASLVWNFGDGTQEKTADLAQAGIQHNYMATGSYQAVLTATDNLGATTSQSITVNVVDTDIPTAKFTVSPSNGGGGAVPITITFDASASTDADGITQYRWLWGSGTEQITTSPTITHTFTTAGTYQVRLRTRDANFAEGVATVPVTVGSVVTGAPSQAQFKVGPPREVQVGTAHSFDGSRSFNPNIGGTLVAYNWNFGDFVTCPGASGGCAGSGVNTTYTYPGARNFFPSLQVQTGSGGLSQLARQEVFAVYAGHAPRAISRASVTGGVAPLTIHFDGTESYDYDGSLSGKSWAVLSNGVCSPNCNISGDTLDFTFTNPGAYQVNLTVFDSDGNATLVSTNISVTSSLNPTQAKRTPYDPDREYLRQLLSNACGSGDGESCSQLADMYAEDGDASRAAQLKAYACQLGYVPACSRQTKVHK